MLSIYKAKTNLSDEQKEKIVYRTAKVVEVDYQYKPIFAGQPYWNVDGDNCQVGDENSFTLWLVDSYGGVDAFISNCLKFINGRDIMSDWMTGDGPEDAESFLKHYLHAEYKENKPTEE